MFYDTTCLCLITFIDVDTDCSSDAAACDNTANSECTSGTCSCKAGYTGSADATECSKLMFKLF